jgi:hypothetical protein
VHAGTPGTPVLRAQVILSGWHTPSSPSVIIQDSPQTHVLITGHSLKGQSFLVKSLSTFVIPSGQTYSSLGHGNMHAGGVSVSRAQVIPSG